jgi:hypothetical protein
MDAAKNPLSRDQLLALIPDDAQRVKVVDEKGQERWRDVAADGLDAILDSDEIVLLSGEPVVMRMRPGRRKKPPRAAPPPAVNQTVAQLQASKSQHFEDDALINKIDHGIDSEDVLYLVMRGFAEEAASLEFERGEAERTGRETSQLSIRRINALKALAETWIKRKEQLAGKSIDMESPAFTKLFDFIIATFREAMMAGGVPVDQAEIVFTRLADRLKDETWEQEAQNRMKGA